MATRPRGPSASGAEILRTLCVALLLTTTLVAGRAEAGEDGDLGRPDHSLTIDDAMDAIAKWFHPGYSFNRSDAEVDMANRLWRFVAPEPRWNWMPARATTLRPSRGLWIGDATTPDRYYAWLHNADYQSSSVRYSTVADDVDADLGTIPGAFESVCAVQHLDHQRRVAEANVPGLSGDVHAAAAARFSANETEIGVFVWALRYRYESYQYALDHLLVETPDPGARAVDEGLIALRHWVRAAARGQFCDAGGFAPHPGNPHPGPTLPSRFTHAGPQTVPSGPNAGS